MQPNNPILPGDENVARLLGQAYEPQDVPAEFARRVHARMQTAAAAAARQRQPLPLPRPRGGFVPRRLAWAVGMAAMLGCIALGVQFGPWSETATRRVTQTSSPLPAQQPLSPERLTAAPRPTTAEAEMLSPGATLTTQAGERRRVLLPDGSVLFVNQQTNLHLDADRHITLHRGEVFVEVAPRTPETFIVQTPQRAVTALGTKFVVRADNAGTNVAVTQGKVKISGWDGVLLAGQQLPAGAARVEPTPRFSHLLDWARDLLGDAGGRLVPESQHSGGDLVAIDAHGQEAKLSLRKYHIDVHIEDGFARTTIDQTYFNHLPSRVEGTFYFPLPADASLSRLAMYVNGDLNEGGMVERDEGRAIYQQIVTKMKDPALLEWLDGTTFKMRVFPLEARQEKRIILSYTQKLPVLYGRSSYRFPAGHSLGEVRDWSFNGRVKNGAGLTWHSDSHALQARTEGKDLVLEASARRVKPDRDVVLDLYEESTESAPNDVARFSSAEHEGAKYLMVRYRPALPALKQRQRRDWVFLFESSGDRDPLLARTQVEIIRTLLANAEHDDTFAVLAAGARVTSFDSQLRLATPENIAAAIAFLEKAHLVGALDLEKALAAAKPLLASAHNPHLVHIGSGLAALGERRADVLARKIPANTRYVGVGVGKRWGRDFMKLAAERTGGAFTQINPDEPIGWRAFELSATLNTPRLLGAHVTDPTGKATFLSHATAIAQGEELCAIARLDGNVALPEQVKITGTLDGQPYERMLDVSDVRPKADYLPRTWAKLEIERLLAENSADNKDRIIALSKSMYVMTPYTSLLVLENEAMYAQYKVDRGRKDHWALYPCPPKIPVVHEPLPGMAGATPAASTGKPTVEQVVTTLVFSPDGNKLASGAVDNTVRLWDVTTGKEIQSEVTDQKNRNVVTTYNKTPTPGFSFYTGLFDDRTTSTPQEKPGLASTSNGSVVTPGLLTPIKASSFGEKIPQQSGYINGFGFNPYFSTAGPLGWADGYAVPGLSTLNDNLNFRYPVAPNALASEVQLDPAKFYKLHTATEAYGLTQLNRQLDEDSKGRMNTWWLNPLAQRDLPRSAYPSLSPGQHVPKELEQLKARVQGPAKMQKLTELGFMRELPDTRRVDRGQVEHELELTKKLKETLVTPLNPQKIHQIPSIYQRPQHTIDLRYFRNLLAFAPGLSTSAADVRAVLENEAGLGDDVRPGKVDPAARELIDRARAAGWCSLSVPDVNGGKGFTVTFDSKGRYRWDRVLPWGLRESVVCDGQTLLHLYPDLGLAARRPWSRYHAAEFRQLVPWLLPTAGELARGADLRLVDDHTVAVVIPEAPIVHLIFGDGGRLIERKVLATDGAVLARETYAANGTVLRFNADSKKTLVSEWKIQSAAKPDLSPDLEELVVLSLPVRTRNHILHGQPLVLANVNGQTALDLLLSDEVFGTPLMADLIREKFLKKGDQRIGFHTLLLASGQSLGMEPPAVWRNDRPLERYCRQVECFSPDCLVWTGGPLNTFWERMGALHAIFVRWTNTAVSIDAAEARRLLRFVSECGSLSTAWTATDLVLRNTANKEEGKQDANDLKRQLLEVLYKITEGSPNLHYAARYEQARLLYQIGEMRKAAELFTELYTQTAAKGVLPAIDGDFRAALTAERSWDKLLRETAVQLILDKHRLAVVALAEQVAALGDVPLGGELIDLSLKGADANERPALQLAGMQHFMRHGQLDKADQLFNELMRDETLAQRADLWRLGVALSQARHQTPRAMTRLERALDLEYAERPAVIDLEAVRRDFGQLLAHYEKVAEAMSLLQQSPPADFTDRVVRFADRWRSLDKDAPAPCETAARILSQVGATDLAWDYRTTPLIHQSEANAWLQLAREKSGQGEVEHADRAFAAAFALSPTNPEVLWERATNLCRPAPTPAARALFRELRNGDWGANTQSWREKAKVQLEP